MQTSVKSLNQIAQEIDDYIRKCGGEYPGWYIGIASDPRARLFNDHNVDNDRNAWIYRECVSSSEARRVEEFFLRKGCDGGTGGGDNSTRYAYAYKKNSHTVQ